MTKYSDGTPYSNRQLTSGNGCATEENTAADRALRSRSDHGSMDDTHKSTKVAIFRQDFTLFPRRRWQATVRLGVSPNDACLINGGHDLLASWAKRARRRDVGDYRVYGALSV